MDRILREAWTISLLFWFISSETLLYLIFKDFSSYIKRLSTNLAQVNILYVKVFQAIASNNNLIDEKTNNELLRFTDNAPWNNGDIRLFELITLVNDNDLCLKHGYEAPINSGMISLVYKAHKNSTGAPIIIKMKRKDIDMKLNNAIENLKTILYLLSFIPIFHKYQIADVINKNIEIIRHQTNFKEEVENIIRVKKNCENLKYVRIPQVYPEITATDPNFILMDYIDGKKINALEEADFIHFSKQVLKFGFVTTIVHGVAHGDLHSGNILFIKDDQDEKYPHKIGVIDFGIIFELNQQYKEALFELLTQALTRNPRETIIHLLNSVIIKDQEVIKKIPKAEYDSIVNIGTELITDAKNNAKNVNQIQLYKFLAKMKEYLCKKELSELGIRPSDDFVKTQLVLAMAHGVTLTLCKDNFVSIMDEVLNELFHTNMILDDM
jgi:predicted unusual protein kinase regulating ubiquinone biosynthesis (AarF/ABC1/UbiB family)